MAHTLLTAKSTELVHQHQDIKVPVPKPDRLVYAILERTIEQHWYHSIHGTMRSGRVHFVAVEIVDTTGQHIVVLSEMVFALFTHTRWKQKVVFKLNFSDLLSGSSQCDLSSTKL